MKLSGLEAKCSMLTAARSKDLFATAEAKSEEEWLVSAKWYPKNASGSSFHMRLRRAGNFFPRAETIVYF